MPNKNKKNRYNQNWKNNNDGMNGTGGNGSFNGGGVRKGNFKGKGQRLYINPNAIITSVSDDEVMPRANNNQNGNRFGSLSRDGEGGSRRRNNKKNRGKHLMSELEGMTKSRPGKMGIGDDDTESAKPILPSKPHMRVSNMPEDVFNIIVNFVQNYFNCFDTNREGLLGAYNKMCTFSFTLNMGNTVAYRQFKFSDLHLKHNRNLKRIVGQDEHHIEKRFKLQIRGYIETLAQLCKMPATEHDPRSFKLDVDFFTPHMIKFSVSGTFKEGKPTDKVRPLRSFNRVFICIPDTASPMTIINEQFTISHITNSQHKAYYYVPPEERSENKMGDSPPKPMAATSASVPVQPVPIQPVVQPMTAAPIVPQFPDLNVQQNLMLREFSAQSKLNFEWSKYCLDHVQWNFDEAAKAFIQFKDSIPKDAYIV